MPRILIIGGHGKIALQLSALLTSQGATVTSVIRNAGQSDDVAATGAQPMVLDVEQASMAELAAEFAGHDAVVWSAGAGGGSPARTYAVDRDAATRSMDAAGEAGIPRYVMVSYFGARTDHGVPPENSFFAYAEAKAAADAYLRTTSLGWTILGPGALTDDSASGRINPAPTQDQRTTSRANVALVAAAVLGRPDTVGHTIEFTDGDLEIEAAIDRALTPR